MNLLELTTFLNTYGGRDKVMRTLCYTSKFASGVVNSETSATKLLTFGNHLSACRTILRLFDDIPMLTCTLDYGLGKQEPDGYMRFLNILKNAIDTIFYPVEHIAWAHDSKLVNLRNGSDTLWTVTTLCWVASLYISLLKALRSIGILQQHKNCLQGTDCDVRTGMIQLASQQRNEMMTAIKCAADLGHAVNSLPEGWLWAGKLQRWQVGALGSISSLLGLYQALSTPKS